MAKESNTTWWAWVISIVTMIMVAFLEISPIYILLVLIVAAFCITWLREKKEAAK